MREQLKPKTNTETRGAQGKNEGTTVILVLLINRSIPVTHDDLNDYWSLKK